MRVYVDQINEDERGVHIASLSVRDRLSPTIMIPVAYLPTGVREGDELEMALFREDNATDLAEVRKLMERLSK